MPDQVKWEYHFKSEPQRVRRVVSEIIARVNEALPGQTPEERGDLRLIFNELLYNAILHGNKSDTCKSVHVWVQIGGGYVRASITDEGCGYNYQKVSEMARSDELQIYKETGRGIQLVLALADQVEFDRNGSQVTFMKRIGARHGG